MARRTSSVTGKPKLKPTPLWRQAAANSYVAPAESARASNLGPASAPGRASGGKLSIAMSSRAMWSAAVLEPALPGRSSPASASPEETSGRSKKQ